MTELAAAPIADAAIRLDAELAFAPAAIGRLVPGDPVQGQAVPCRHSGSVDVFLEAIAGAPPGGILVIDNDGRLDEGCIGDLVALEAKLAGIAGIVIWGLHRDTTVVRDIGLPLWSMGSVPVGPTSARRRPDDALETAYVGDIRVTRESFVVADDDGVLFLPAVGFDAVVAEARRIASLEGKQAKAMYGGRNLREQLDFDGYLKRRAQDPAYGLRQHLAERGGAVEA
jgi:4-hydroxy-4-methyl-2-oxoglutarate aldolase